MASWLLINQVIGGLRGRATDQRAHATALDAAADCGLDEVDMAMKR